MVSQRKCVLCEMGIFHHVCMMMTWMIDGMQGGNTVTKSLSRWQDKEAGVRMELGNTQLMCHNRSSEEASRQVWV